MRRDAERREAFELALHLDRQVLGAREQARALADLDQREGAAAGDVLRVTLEQGAEQLVAACGGDRDDVRVFTCGLVVRGFDIDEGLPMDLGKAVADAPELAHGDDTVWAGLDASAAGVHAALRRLGAFSLHSGAVTLVWTALAYRRPALRTWLLFTYLVTGLGFAWTDATYFAGTRYYLMKQILGGLFAAAMVVHFAARWRARRE